MRASFLIAALCAGALACTNSSHTCQTWECPGQALRAQSCTDTNSPITTWNFGSLICEIDADHTQSAASLSCNAALATFCSGLSSGDGGGSSGGSAGSPGGGAGGGSAGGSGGGSAPTNVVTGTVGGVGISGVAEATSLVVDPNCAVTQSLPSVLALVILDTQGGVCASFTSHADQPSNTVLRLSVGAVRLNGSSDPIAITPGTYVINNLTPANGLLLTAVADLSQTDAQCGVTSDVSAGSGSITVASIASSGLTGSFNLQFGGGSLNGTFAAPDCGVSQLTYCAGQQGTDSCAH